MSGLVKILLYFVASVALSLLVAPLVIKIMRKLKAKQTVLGYVKQHEHKSGTPTMGGFIFLLPTIVFSLVEFQRFSLVAAALSAGFCVLGFLDDFIKIRYARNLGLKPYQKIIGQLGLSFAAGWFAYASKDVGSAINLPFSTFTLNMSWGIIPFVMLVYVATTNCVNLTDGLDGLAAGTVMVVMLVMAAIAFRAGVLEPALFAGALAGACIGFLWFNSHPADIFMGDTGSLALGMALGCLAVVTKTEFVVIIIGGLFVAEALSVMIQVFYYKKTKKRIFLMAPLHHHFEKKGWSETKVVVRFWIVSGMLAACGFVLYFATTLGA